VIRDFSVQGSSFKTGHLQKMAWSPPSLLVWKAYLESVLGNRAGKECLERVLGLAQWRQSFDALGRQGQIDLIKLTQVVNPYHRAEFFNVGLAAFRVGKEPASKARPGQRHIVGASC